MIKKLKFLPKNPEKLKKNLHLSFRVKFPLHGVKPLAITKHGKPTITRPSPDSPKGQTNSPFPKIQFPVYLIQLPCGNMVVPAIPSLIPKNNPAPRGQKNVP
jgi:hypothetical protein